MHKLGKVLSGGQTGVDQAALRAAMECGVEVGGWCPPGRGCEDGVIPPQFPLKETDRDRSQSAPDVPRSQRTEWNVRDSDGTLVILTGNRSGNPVSPGTDWTIECAARYNRPLLICDVSDPEAKKMVQRWVAAHSISTLNVAGPSEGTAPGIGEHAYALLRRVFQEL